MNYKEIREASKLSKRSHQNEQMETNVFGRLTVCSNDNIDAILIDTENAEFVASRKWCLDNAGYPVINLDKNVVRLHDYILANSIDEKPEGYYVDHINQDKLDNRKTNLRLVNPDESSHNMPMRSNNKSGYTGVCKTKEGSYRAYITKDHKQINLGRYNTPEEASLARCEAESRLGFKTKTPSIKEKLRKSDEIH